MGILSSIVCHFGLVFIPVSFSPQLTCEFKGLNPPLLPPGLLIAAGVQISVVERAERDGELIRDLPAHGAGLRKAEVMGFGW